VNIGTPFTRLGLLRSEKFLKKLLDILSSLWYNTHMKNENECLDCDELAMDNSEFCDECAYEHGEPIEPWQPDPREDGGYFGWAGMTEA
tara:strand:- start:1710 stop:1976 length:267 start_codon:yes stop_codon:yes gene_type:complete